MTITSSTTSPPRPRRFAGLVATVVSVGLVAAGCAADPDLDESVVGSRSKATAGDGIDCGKDPKNDKVPASDGVSVPRLGAGEGKTTPMSWVAHQIGEDLFDFGADEGFGWVLHELTGENRASAENDRRIREIYNNTVDLRSQVYSLCQQLDSRMNELEGAVDLKAYQSVAIGVKTGAIASLTSFQNDYTRIVKTATADKTYVMDSEDLDKLDEIRMHIVDKVINPLDEAMTNSSDGDGMIGMYADVLGDKYGFRPTPTQEHPNGTWIFTPEYLAASYDQLNYYGGAMVQALLLYADVVNTAYKNGAGEQRPAKPQQGADEADDVSGSLAAWAAQMWNGRGSHGKDPWVPHDLGMIPDDTVADLRVQGKPRLWTDKPYKLTGDSFDVPPAYCGRPTTWCWSETYDNDGKLTSRTPVRPTSGPINRLISRQQPLGFTDWRVPTKTDWDDFVSGVSGGLTAWSKQMHLPQLAGTEVPLHSGGVDRKATVFAPVLVDLDGRGTGFATYSAPTGDANGVTLTKSTDTRELAGRVFLVRDIPDVKPTPPQSARQGR